MTMQDRAELKQTFLSLFLLKQLGVHPFEQTPLRIALMIARKNHLPNWHIIKRKIIKELTAEFELAKEKQDE